MRRVETTHQRLCISLRYVREIKLNEIKLNYTQKYLFFSLQKEFIVLGCRRI